MSLHFHWFLPTNGARVGGMESALSLGDMGFRVLLVEQEASVGGRMILLSKVFPTLDCASCISTPKMAGVNGDIRTLGYTKVGADIVPKGGGGFPGRLTRKCHIRGCGKVYRLRALRSGLHGRVPRRVQLRPRRPPRRPHRIPAGRTKKAVITRHGTSPARSHAATKSPSWTSRASSRTTSRVCCCCSGKESNHIFPWKRFPCRQKEPLGRPRWPDGKNQSGNAQGL